MEFLVVALGMIGFAVFLVLIIMLSEKERKKKMREKEIVLTKTVETVHGGKGNQVLDKFESDWHQSERVKPINKVRPRPQSQTSTPSKSSKSSNDTYSENTVFIDTYNDYSNGYDSSSSSSCDSSSSDSSSSYDSGSSDSGGGYCD